MGAIKRHILVGVGAGFLLIMVYLSIITLAQDLTHALGQAAELWYWVLALAGGFGIQVGLFSFIRQGIRERRAATAGSIAASGAVSAGSMAACCAHHLSDVLPLLGLAGLSAFVVRYQFFFIILGVLSNVVGIATMLETIQRHSLCPWVAGWKWDMRWVKRGLIISSVLILLITGFRTLLGA